MLPVEALALAVLTPVDDPVQEASDAPTPVTVDVPAETPVPNGAKP